MTWDYFECYFIECNFIEHKFYFLYIKTEFQKITNFLDTTSDDKDLPKFITKKWIEVYDRSGKNYNPNKEIRIKTSMLRSDLCDFSDANIVVKGNITVVKIYLNIVKNIKKQQEVSGIIIEMNQIVIQRLII